MNKNLENAQVLHKDIKKILLYDWDPIGIQDVPSAQDEYDSYVGDIYKLIITMRPSVDIFDYLWWIESEHMGLIGNRQKTLKVAEKLRFLR